MLVYSGLQGATTAHNRHSVRKGKQRSTKKYACLSYFGSKHIHQNYIFARELIVEFELSASPV